MLITFQWLINKIGRGNHVLNALQKQISISV